VALALAQTAPELLGAAGLLGLGVSVTWPAQDALLSSVVGRVGRSAAFSVRHATFNGGTALGAMVIFAIGETLFSPTLPAIINDLAPPEAVGRYNGLGVLAFTTGFLLGPVSGAALLSATGGVLFPLLTVACLGAAGAALGLGRRLAPA
jgi:MFS family permease